MYIAKYNTYVAMHVDTYICICMYVDTNDNFKDSYILEIES